MKCARLGENVSIALATLRTGDQSGTAMCRVRPRQGLMQCRIYAEHGREPTADAVCVMPGEDLAL
jgi:hypothetical protein